MKKLVSKSRDEMCSNRRFIADPGRAGGGFFDSLQPRKQSLRDKNLVTLLSGGPGKVWKVVGISEGPSNNGVQNCSSKPGGIEQVRLGGFEL